MRRGIFGAWAHVLAVIPLGGLVVLATATARGLRRARLLRVGHLVLGTLADKQPTQTKVNNRVV